MVPISLSDEIQKRIPGLKLGMLKAENVLVQDEAVEFEQLFDQLRAYLTRSFSAEPLSSHPVVGHVRKMYRRVGWEPTRYRPSSEALARRILQNKGWYRINNLVDLANIVSARFHLPMGLYDLDKIQGAITLDVGRDGETYEGISKKLIHAEGKLILRDEIGIFGNPTADSQRTAITDSTLNILAIFFVPPEVADGYAVQALETLDDYYLPYRKKSSFLVKTF